MELFKAYWFLCVNSQLCVMSFSVNQRSFGKDYKNIHVFLLMSFTQVNDLPANKETQLWSVSAEILSVSNKFCIVL